MYREVSKLIMFGDTDPDCILYRFSDIFRRFDAWKTMDEIDPAQATKKAQIKSQLIRDIYTQLNRLMIVATDYGFDENLWHNYLTFYLVTNENPLSITCEKVGANEGSVKNAFADLPVEVGAKTGTAQVGQVNSESNAVLVCFAPYDDPEIAVSVVVEHGGSGTDLAGIAAEILSYYFSTGTTMESVDGENQLLH